MHTPLFLPPSVVSRVAILLALSGMAPVTLEAQFGASARGDYLAHVDVQTLALRQGVAYPDDGPGLDYYTPFRIGVTGPLNGSRHLISGTLGLLRRNIATQEGGRFERVELRGVELAGLYGYRFGPDAQRSALRPRPPRYWIHALTGVTYWGGSATGVVGEGGATTRAADHRVSAAGVLGELRVGIRIVKRVYVTAATRVTLRREGYAPRSEDATGPQIARRQIVARYDFLTVGIAAGLRRGYR